MEFRLRQFFVGLMRSADQYIPRFVSSPNAFCVPTYFSLKSPRMNTKPTDHCSGDFQLCLALDRPTNCTIRGTSLALTCYGSPTRFSPLLLGTLFQTSRGFFCNPSGGCLNTVANSGRDWERDHEVCWRESGYGGFLSSASMTYGERSPAHFNNGAARN